ncbi:hypothetical protein DIC82_00250 [Clostridium beijerinckii]|nr:hypothetical protein DIC82_00250 [Clostridium beijerinckii]
MKKIFACISIILLIGFVVLAKETEYALIGCAIFIVILSVFTFHQFYKYHENKKEISNICFTLKRDNLMAQIINCTLFAYHLFNDISNNKLNASENTDFLISIGILIYVVIQLYIVVFHTPKLSTNGFLCSDGNFIFFDKIKSIKSEDGAMLLCKKLTVEYDEDKSELFKADRFDYENIKNHLGMYGSLHVEEIN